MLAYEAAKSCPRIGGLDMDIFSFVIVMVLATVYILAATRK